MKTKQMIKLAACGASLMMLLTVSARAASIYIGDAASAGKNLNTADYPGGDSAPTVTFVFIQPDTTYTPSSAMQLQVSEVNFIAARAQAGLTWVQPFLAAYNGSGGGTGANYTVLWLGDSISVDTVGLKNFTLTGGENVITLSAGTQLVAGYASGGLAGIIPNLNVATTVTDYLGTSNLLPSAIGSKLTGNPSITLNRTMAFNIGLELLQIPEPSTVGLLAIGAALMVSARLLRKRQ